MTPQELTAIRRSLGLSKTELAEKLGMTRQTIGGYEAGRLHLPRWLKLAMTGLQLTSGPARNVADRLLAAQQALAEIKGVLIRVEGEIPEIKAARINVPASE